MPTSDDHSDEVLEEWHLRRELAWPEIGRAERRLLILLLVMLGLVSWIAGASRFTEAAVIGLCIMLLVFRRQLYGRLYDLEVLRTLPGYFQMIPEHREIALGEFRARKGQSRTLLLATLWPLRLAWMAIFFLVALPLLVLRVRWAFVGGPDSAERYLASFLP